MNFSNSFMVFGLTATPADYTSMEEMGTMFYRGKSPLQSTRQLLTKIRALEPSESSGGARRLLRATLSE